MPSSSLPWWHPARHADRRPRLLARVRAVAAIRAFLSGRGYLEVETPPIQVSPGLEPHLKAFATELEEPFGEGSRRLYLHTSPEFAMKKLMVAGESALFQLAPVFRNGERGPTHHPAFTMLEWYRRNLDWRDLMEECAELVRAVTRATGAESLLWGGATVDPFAPWERLSVAEALDRYAGVDLMAALEAGIALSGDPMEPAAAPLIAAATALGLSCGENDRFEDVFFRIVLDRVEPRLGYGVPTILHSYPVCMAALSRPRADDPRLAERFEVYVAGVELANAFGELTDAAEQRARFTHDMDLKEALYGERYPLDEEFLAALTLGMAPCSGIALGLERLVMLCTGAEDITEVVWAPVPPPPEDA